MWNSLSKNWHQGKHKKPGPTDKAKCWMQLPCAPTMQPGTKAIEGAAGAQHCPNQAQWALRQCLLFKKPGFLHRSGKVAELKTWHLDAWLTLPMRKASPLLLFYWVIIVRVTQVHLLSPHDLSRRQNPLCNRVWFSDPKFTCKKSVFLTCNTEQASYQQGLQAKAHPNPCCIPNAGKQQTLRWTLADWPLTLQ